MKYIWAFLLLAIPLLSYAHCDGVKHAGNHPHCGGEEPPPPPPPDCTDEFPGFLYGVEATRKSPGEIWLSSSDGCRSELVAVQSDDGRGGGAFHMTADKSKGVLLWTEDPGNTEHYLVYQQDFTVDASGVLTLETPFQLLPLDGEIIPAAVNYYFSMDIWGDATHDSLYMAVFRNYAFGSGPEDGIKELLIYNLNDMTDVRKIYSDTEAAFEWNCPDVSNPQFVPTCYRPENIRFNPSGTRLYMNHNTRDTLGQRWDAGLRIHIDYLNAVTGGVANLTDWIFSAPELVYTGTDETSGALARPENDSSLLPDPELIAVRKFQDVGSILDADQCAYEYSFYVSGAWSLPPDFWHQCIVTGTFFSPNIHGGGDSWQSPDAILTSTYARRGYDIYRRYIAGPLAGTEELLIENARGADTGY